MTLELKYRDKFMQGREEGREQGRAEGEHSAKLETARRMISKHYDIDDISEMTSLSIQEIQALH